MNPQIKQRLFITLVVLAMLGLLVIGPKTLTAINEARSAAWAECFKDNLLLIDFCRKQTDQQISPSFYNYLSPFLPAAVLVWVAWLFKLSFQIELDLTQAKKIGKVVYVLACLVATLGIFFPFLIVLEKELERLHSILIYQLFLTPWVTVCWLCAPLLFQKLLDPENRMVDILKLRKFALAVIATPFLATILLTLRQALSF